MPAGKRDISDHNHEYYMSLAISEAIVAGKRGDKPIAAILVHDNIVIGKMTNTWNTRNSKVHHAENWLCMENANYLKKFGKECIIYTTLEPCIMCVSTIVMADIRNIVIGMKDKYMKTNKMIKVMPWINDRIFNYVTGILHEQCLKLIMEYGDEKDKENLI